MLNKAVLKNTLKQKSTWLLLGLALFPLITVITELLGSDLMRLSGEPASISCLGLIAALFDTMNRMMLPVIILAYMASQMFYEEIQTGRLGFYKDQPRKDVLNAKVQSLVVVYVLHFLILILSTTLAYYILYSMGTMPVLSGDFFGDYTPEVIKSLYDILAVVADSFAVLFITIAISTKASSGYTILGAIFASLFTMLAGLAKEATYIVPSGYLTVLDGHSAWVKVLGVILVALVYILTSYYIAKRNFQKAEY